MVIRRLWQRLVGLGVGVVFLASCGTTYSPPLTARGIPAEERRDYIIQNGFGLPEHIKTAFLDGYVVEGMTREMVFNLFGTADRAGDKDLRWEYVNRKGALVTGIDFKGDKVSKIDGDPSGGSGKAPVEALPVQ